MSPHSTVTLTERQVETLDMTSQGLTCGEIAKKLGTSVSAVTTCLHRAYLKLGANSAAHAVRIGLETGVIPGSEVSDLRAELTRVYRALAVANSSHDSGRVRLVQAHSFGEYLLGLEAA